jgi:hypothetical protein
MRAEHNVVVPQVRTNTGSDGFFANVGVAGTLNQTALMSFGELLFTLSDDKHRAVKVEVRLSRDVGLAETFHETVKVCLKCE